ncbi:ATPase-like, ParA/MinD [Desulfofundulus kuznetsovii DSM 6115]|uniref:Iron-sulfur cluster carrier protein n=1 Tax=Desulfofundulus kuznetsovii (strain DSM 6115 / VKM B-1805 / 17) TaxID=760568 RepID=A0AAU8PZ73_DESK7|nr:ATPase-like, ParA/MinD [Desulfofundulus kuznetsovii DSM 6115]
MTQDKAKCSTCKDKNTGQCNPEKCAEPAVLPLNEASDIKRVVAVMSGKGGVGKSSVSALLAVALARRGHQVGILDADITGPSIPKLFGVIDRPEQFNKFILPARTITGIRMMSLNLLLPREDDPVIWRGPILSGAVKQFWTDVAWGKLDYLIVDMPPGTGDVPLTVMQSLPLDGLLVVSSPQDLSMMVVRKAIKMARLINVPILGLVENMSYLLCPHCGEKVYLFGSSHVGEAAQKNNLPLLAVLPIDPNLTELGDAGLIENYNGPSMQNIEPLVEVLEKTLNKKTIKEREGA